MSNFYDAFFPTGCVLEEIRTRWATIAEQPFSELKKHVEALAPTPAGVGGYSATFSACRRGGWRRTRTGGGKGDPWFRRQTAELEIAVAWCIAAQASEAKPLATMLADAHACCALFDELLVAERAAHEARYAAQCNGGRERQLRLEPARQLARDLADLYCPPGGWKSPRAAAKVVEPYLRSFIIEKHLSLTLEESLLRTISNWLRQHFARGAK